MAADGGQEAQQRARFQRRRARCVGQQQVARAQHLQQAGHAQAGVRAQLQRVQPLVVHALDQRVHRLQALECLEVEALVAHRQVVALDQGQAQVARQVGVLEVGFVVGAGREQGDARVLTLGRQRLDAVHQRPVAGSQALHLHAGKGLGELPCDGDAVFQQVAQTRGRLGALADHPPATIGTVREVEGGDVQPGVARRRHTLHGAQVAGMALGQRRGQQGAAQQLLRAIEVGHHAVEQARALQHAGLDLCPFPRVHDHGEQVERPGALQAAGGVGVDVVGDAVVADLALQVLGAAVQVGQTVGTYVVEEAAPARGQGPRVAAVAQLVAVPGVGGHRPRQGPVPGGFGAEFVEQVVSGFFRGHGSGVCPWRLLWGTPGRFGPLHPSKTRGCDHWRKSSVNGNSRLGVAAFTTSLPAVWPIWKKRERRRLSAS